MRLKVRWGIALLAIPLALAMVATPTFAAGTVIVYPGNMDGWSFHKFDGNFMPTTAGTAEMVNGPATPPLGTGSAHLATAPGAGDGSAQIGSSDYDGVKLSQITSLSYSTYMTANNGQQFPYLVLCVSTTGGTTPDDFVEFEPPYQNPTSGNPALPNQGPTMLNTWQRWNALEGGWYSGLWAAPGAAVQPLSNYISLYPNATIANSSQCVSMGAAGGIGLQVGYGSPTDNFDGNVDAPTIGVSGTDTTYDFELIGTGNTGGGGGTASQGWAGTTRYSGQSCNVTSPYTGTQYTTTNAHEIDTPNEAILQCTYQSTEHPPKNLLVTGTTGCQTHYGNSYYYYTTENPAGLITLRCYAYAQNT